MAYDSRRRKKKDDSSDDNESEEESSSHSSSSNNSDDKSDNESSSSSTKSDDDDGSDNESDDDNNNNNNNNNKQSSITGLHLRQKAKQLAQSTTDNIIVNSTTQQLQKMKHLLTDNNNNSSSSSGSGSGSSGGLSKRNSFSLSSSSTTSSSSGNAIQSYLKTAIKQSTTSATNAMNLPQQILKQQILKNGSLMTHFNNHHATSGSGSGGIGSDANQQKTTKTSYNIASLSQLKQMESDHVLESFDMDKVYESLEPFSANDFDPYEYIDQVYDKTKMKNRMSKRDHYLKNRLKKQTMNVQQMYENNTKMIKSVTNTVSGAVTKNKIGKLVTSTIIGHNNENENGNDDDDEKKKKNKGEVMSDDELSEDSDDGGDESDSDDDSDDDDDDELSNGEHANKHKKKKQTKNGNQNASKDATNGGSGGNDANKHESSSRLSTRKRIKSLLMTSPFQNHKNKSDALKEAAANNSGASSQTKAHISIKKGVLNIVGARKKKKDRRKKLMMESSSTPTEDNDSDPSSNMGKALSKGNSGDNGSGNPNSGDNIVVSATKNTTNMVKGVVKAAIDKEAQMRLVSIKKRNKKIVIRMRSVSQEQLVVLKQYRRNISTELQREVNSHYTLFINTSRAVSQMEQDWNMISSHFNEVVDTCRFMSQWNEQETNRRMNKLKRRIELFKQQQEQNNSSSYKSASNVSNDPLTLLTEINAEMVAAIYSHQLDYAMDLFLSGVQLVNQLTDFNSNVEQQNNEQQQKKDVPQKTANRNSSSGTTPSNVNSPANTLAGRAMARASRRARTLSIVSDETFQEMGTVKNMSGGANSPNSDATNKNGKDNNKADGSGSTWEIHYKQLIQVIQTFDDNCARLLDLMLSEIRMKINWSSIEYYRSLINNLTLMDAKNEAIFTYFGSQADLIRDSLCKITGMTGDPVTYASILSRRFFRLIADAAKRYKSIFGASTEVNNNNDDDDYGQASGLVQWLANELHRDYCSTFKQQVFSGCNRDLDLVTECCFIAFDQSNQLKQEGIHLSYLVRDSFTGDIANAIETFVWKHEDNIFAKLNTESWVGSMYSLRSDLAPISSVAFGLSDKISLYVTETGKLLYLFCDQFINLLKRVSSIQLYQTCVTHVTRLFEQHLVQVFKIAVSSSLSDPQYFSLICNVNTIVNRLIPFIGDLLERLFAQKVSEMSALASKTKDLDGRIMKQYIENRVSSMYYALEMSSKSYPKQNRSTSQVISTVDDIQVSSPFRKMVLFLARLNTIITNEFSHMKKGDTIIVNLLEKLASVLSSKSDVATVFWQRLPTLSSDSSKSPKSSQSKNKKKKNNSKKKRHDSDGSDGSDDSDSDKSSDNESGEEELDDSEEEQSEDEHDEESEEEHMDPSIVPFTDIDVCTIVLDVRFLIESCKRFMNSKTKLQLTEFYKMIGDLSTKPLPPQDLFLNKIEDLLEQDNDLAEAIRQLEEAHGGAISHKRPNRTNTSTTSATSQKDEATSVRSPSPSTAPSTSTTARASSPAATAVTDKIKETKKTRETTQETTREPSSTSYSAAEPAAAAEPQQSKKPSRRERNFTLAKK